MAAAGGGAAGAMGPAATGGAAVLPDNLAAIRVFLRTADEVRQRRPRVAYLCRVAALEEAIRRDPHSRGRQVLQFKTELLQQLEKEEHETRQSRVESSDLAELRSFFEEYAREISESMDAELTQKQRSRLARQFHTAAVIYDVLRTQAAADTQELPEELKDLGRQVVIQAKELTRKAYNMVPLDGVSDDGITLPEVTMTVAAFKSVADKLPKTSEMPANATNLDVFDWLQALFGFQSDNVRNQRENVALLLANAQSRFMDTSSSATRRLDPRAVTWVANKTFHNYREWCQYLNRPPNVPSGASPDADWEDLLLFTALFYLIWGEAANLRFVPECLCYIVHNMTHDVKSMRNGNAALVELPAIGAPEYSFLKKVVTPFYEVCAKEADFADESRKKRNSVGFKPHTAWRNYDDINEFFWSERCFELSWPLDRKKNFFVTPKEKITPAEKRMLYEKSDGTGLPDNTREREHKTFLEKRSWLVLFRSWDRLFNLYILSLQLLIVIAFREQSLFSTQMLRLLGSLIVTYALLNLFQALLDLWFAFGIWTHMPVTRLLRLFGHAVMHAGCAVVLLVWYILVMDHKQFKYDIIYIWFIIAYVGPTIFRVLIRLIPIFNRCLATRSNGVLYFLFCPLIWWSNTRLYVGRELMEPVKQTVGYLLYWLALLACKFTFSYFLQVRPLVRPTRSLWKNCDLKYNWFETIGGCYNLGAIFFVWAPIVLVYFMDMQVWYAIFSTLVGGFTGLSWRLGEIRTMGVLTSRFRSLPAMFCKKLLPKTGSVSATAIEQARAAANPYRELLLKRRPSQRLDHVGPNGELTARPERLLSEDSMSEDDVSQDKKLEPYVMPLVIERAERFAGMWNEVMESMREEDLISDDELDRLLMPIGNKDMPVIQWPLFLLAGYIHSAMELAAGDLASDEDVWNEIEQHDYQRAAVIEAYVTAESMLKSLVIGAEEVRVVGLIFEHIQHAISHKDLFMAFDLQQLRSLHTKVVALADLLSKPAMPDKHNQVVRLLQNLYDATVHDFMRPELRKEFVLQETSAAGSLFLGTPTQPVVRYPPPPEEADKLMAQAKRLKLLLTLSNAHRGTLHSEEAKRRLKFFTNSMFMKMPKAPPTRSMLSFCVLTPYYSEDVVYSIDQILKENMDGVSILYYLRTIYPDEWENFLKRMRMTEEEVWKFNDGMELRLWASYRGQTLARTVRGMMYYQKAIQLQAFFDHASADVFREGFKKAMSQRSGPARHVRNWANAIAHLKFTYVVSCQIYGKQKKSNDQRAADISELMKRYESLRVAYIDEVEVPADPEPGETAANNAGIKMRTDYYSVLMKYYQGREQEVYRIKLPGKAKLGEGKPENQNHSIVFTRGEAMQAIDMNQDHYLEEAFKMRNLLQELEQGESSSTGEKRFPNILGVREHIFTGSVSSLAHFMSLQETSFVTIGQRVMANPLRVRMHYGHPDVFDRVWTLTRGGMSKASRVINLSEDIFAGFNSTLRGGLVTHHEYIQCGKGRDVGLNQITNFEAKVSSGNGEQVLTRDVFRISRNTDFFRMLSFYHTSVGFYVNNIIVVLAVYIYLYGRMWISLSGIEEQIVHISPALNAALNGVWILQVGLLTSLPMIVELGIEVGFRKALLDILQMQLQLAWVFFTLGIGTKAHYFGRTLTHGGAKYRPTGRGFVVQHETFAENYRMYSRSHFTKAIEMLLMLILYAIFGFTEGKYGLLTFAIWILVVAWLFGPFLLNPSGLDWQKTVDDYKDFVAWLSHKGGYGVAATASWESWWDEEQDYFFYTGWRGRLFEVILSLRFFVFQFGIAYTLSTARTTSIGIYIASWIMVAAILISVKVVNIFHAKYGGTSEFLFRLVKAFIFFAVVAAVIALLATGVITFGNIGHVLLALAPTFWGVVLIGVALRPWMERFGVFSVIRSIAQAYDTIIGLSILLCIAVVAWFPFFGEMQTRLLFNQAFSRGLQISRILAGKKKVA
eukprot:jgi/Chlat1/1861/Chrsp141S02179